MRDIKFVQSLITGFLEAKVFRQTGTVDQRALVDGLAEAMNELLCQCILPGELKERKSMQLKEEVEGVCKLAILVRGKMEACREEYRFVRPTYGQRALLSDLWRHEDAPQQATKTAESDEMIVTLCHLPGLMRVAVQDGQEVVVVLPEVGTMEDKSQSRKTEVEVMEKALFEPVSAVPVAVA